VTAETPPPSGLFVHRRAADLIEYVGEAVDEHRFAVAVVGHHRHFPPLVRRGGRGLEVLTDVTFAMTGSSEARVAVWTFERFHAGVKTHVNFETAPRRVVRLTHVALVVLLACMTRANDQLVK
jgi:hypothetical protein